MEFDFGTTNVVRGVEEDEGDADAGVRRNAEEWTPLKPVDAERGRAWYVSGGRSVLVRGERRGGREFVVCPATFTTGLVSGWLAARCRDMTPSAKFRIRRSQEGESSQENVQGSHQSPFVDKTLLSQTRLLWDAPLAAENH